MTLKELFLKVGFDSIRPHLERFEPEYLDSIYAFREAYDLLCRMEPVEIMEPVEGEEKEVRVGWDGGEIEGEEKWIGASLPSGGTDWEGALAGEIVVDDDVHLSDEEIAMYCLWELTYWGFSPAEIEKSFKRFKRHKPAGPYEIALDKLEESIWRHQTPRRLRSRGPNGERYIDAGDAKACFKRVYVRKNRSKRKRDYRQKKRIDYLKKMIALENMVAFLTSEGSSFKRSDVDFLWQIEDGIHYDYRSVTDNAEGRLDYILESMTRYQQIPLEKYDNAVVLVSVPACSPLEEPELEKFKEAVRLLLGYDDTLFGMKTVEHGDHHLEVFLLLNRRFVSAVK